MLPLIGFFHDCFNNFAGLYMFVVTPLSELMDLPSDIPLIGDLSILQLLGVGLIGFLGGVLLFHLIRLFVGG